jgi:hypothetical protein
MKSQAALLDADQAQSCREAVTLTVPGPPLNGALIPPLFREKLHVLGAGT